MDFEENNLNHSLLIDNPFINVEASKISFIIPKDIKIYKKILSEERKIISSKFQSYATPFKEFFFIFTKNRKVNKNENTNDNNKTFKNDIITIYINLYYYEEQLLINKEKSFNPNNLFYLIDYNWLTEFKKYYKLDKLDNFQEKFNSNNPKIKYNNLNNFITDIVNEYLMKFQLNFSEIKLPINLQNIKMIDPLSNLQNISKINCYIIPYNIFYLMIKWSFQNQRNLFVSSNIKVINKDILLYK